MQLGQRTRPIIIALASVGAAIVLRVPLEPWLRGTQVWLTFWPAVFVAAWLGGSRAALGAAVLSVATVWLWLFPSSVLNVGNAIIGDIVFVVCSAAIAYLAELATRARREEVRLREKADVARREAQEANRAKDEFLAMLGHELRNPLAPIGSATKLLRQQVLKSHELDVIERQVGHMTRLVDDLLDVSRIVRGELELHRRVVDLTELVERAVEIARPGQERSEHRVEVEVPAGIYVDVDPPRVVQVITNLLVNAIKYSSPDAPITITASVHDSRVRLAIRDRGVGMDSALLARAFEPFEQGAQPIHRSAGGLGLGLAIARHIVTLHGGTLSATSAVGEGTEVVISLPTTTQPATVERITPQAKSGDVKRQKILIVDDNIDAAEMLGMLMEDHGHEVRVAHDGPRALEILGTFEPTIAVLDIGLPGMDGYELVRRMRERGSAARIVALTGYGRESDRERALAAGFDDHLVKPVDVTRIDALIEKQAA